jgi:hypothetical protein
LDTNNADQRIRVHSSPLGHRKCDARMKGLPAICLC